MISEDDSNKPPFRVGDMVMFISGGPVMTVIDFTLITARCGWFDTYDNYHTADFNCELLRIYA